MIFEGMVEVWLRHWKYHFLGVNNSILKIENFTFLGINYFILQKCAKLVVQKGIYAQNIYGEETLLRFATSTQHFLFQN